DELCMGGRGRRGEGSAVSGWTQVLNTQGAAVVVSGIENSVEGRVSLVRQLYIHYLARVPTDDEAMAWVTALQNGLSEEQAVQAFLASTEFFNRSQQLFNTGNGDQKFAQAMYQVVLNRSGSTLEVSSWTVATGLLGRATVAAGFVASPEFRTNAITALYISILHRNPDDAGLAGWSASSFSLHDIRVAFLSSPEALASA